MSAVTSCVSAKGEENFSAFSSPAQVEPSWKTLNSYADAFDFFITEPQAYCHGIKIDLQNQSLEISPFPAISSGPRYSSVSASHLSKNNDIVINTVPYQYSTASISFKKPVGILQTDFIRYSKINEKYAAIAFYREENSFSAVIFQSQNQIPVENGTKNVHCIQGGFWQIIKNGEIIDFKNIQDSRTAIGLSKDGRFLYLLVVEGEKKSRSTGLSFNQCADILIRMGAWNAMEFDGGHSSCLYINGKNALNYQKNPSLPAFLCFSTKIK